MVNETMTNFHQDRDVIESKIVTTSLFSTIYNWELRRSERNWEPFALAVLETSEEVMSELESALLDTLRACNIATRLGSNRIAVLLTHTSIKRVPDFALRVRVAFQTITGKDSEFLVGSCGFPTDNTDLDSMLQKAYTALEIARTIGPNAVFPLVDTKAAFSRRLSPLLVVDDDARNRKLLLNSLQGRGYEITEAESGEQALIILQDRDFDLILLDVMMPGINGFDTCRRIKSREQTKQTPVILMTALDDLKSKVTGIDAGADDFLTKPFDLEELIARAASLVRLKKIHTGMMSIENVIISLAAAVEAKDRYTQGHTDRTSRLSAQLGRCLSLPEEDINCLRIGGALHDIGKIGVPESILNKPGPLTKEEWDTMKTHPEIGHRICESLGKTLGNALDVVKHHHERLDGSSYPDGLKGNEISVVSRIMGVVDVYDALTTDRPYRPAMEKELAFSILRKEAAEGKLDTEIVETLCKVVQ